MKAILLNPGTDYDLAKLKKMEKNCSATIWKRKILILSFKKLKRSIKVASVKSFIQYFEC